MLVLCLGAERLNKAFRPSSSGEFGLSARRVKLCCFKAPRKTRTFLVEACSAEASVLEIFSMHSPARIVFLGLACFFATATTNALEIGAAACDITPDVTAHKVPLAGYGARKNKPSTGIHDPLHAKVLFLRDGKKSMALVTCDLRSVTPLLKQQSLQKAADLGLTTDTLFLCGSHTHDGPSIYPEKFWQLQFGECDPAVIDAMSSSIAAGLHAAAKNLASARCPSSTCAIASLVIGRTSIHRSGRCQNDGW